MGDNHEGERPMKVVAELSANHNGSEKQASHFLRIVQESGADLVKFQHYRPETMTVRSALSEFIVKGGTLWDGRQLFELY